MDKIKERVKELYPVYYWLGRILTIVFFVFALFMIIAFGSVVYEIVSKQQNINGFIYGYAGGTVLLTNIIFGLARLPMLSNSSELVQTRIHQGGIHFALASIILIFLAGWHYISEINKGNWFGEDIQNKIRLFTITILICISFITTSIGFFKIGQVYQSWIREYLDKLPKS